MPLELGSEKDEHKIFDQLDNLYIKIYGNMVVCSNLDIFVKSHV